MGGSSHTSLYRDYTYLIAGFIFIGSFVKTALIIRFTARDDVNYIDVCVRAFKYLLADIRYTRHRMCQWHIYGLWAQQTRSV